MSTTFEMFAVRKSGPNAPTAQAARERVPGGDGNTTE